MASYRSDGKSLFMALKFPNTVQSVNISTVGQDSVWQARLLDNNAFIMVLRFCWQRKGKAIFDGDHERFKGKLCFV